ncbi:hypothetical protein H4I95_11624 [Botrytis cinerea]
MYHGISLIGDPIHNIDIATRGVLMIASPADSHAFTVTKNANEFIDKSSQGALKNAEKSSNEASAPKNVEENISSVSSLILNEFADCLLSIFEIATEEMLFGRSEVTRMHTNIDWTAEKQLLVEHGVWDDMSEKFVDDFDKVIASVEKDIKEAERNAEGLADAFQGDTKRDDTDDDGQDSGVEAGASKEVKRKKKGKGKKRKVEHGEESGSKKQKEGEWKELCVSDGTEDLI